MKRKGYCGRIRIFNRKTKEPELPSYIIYEPPEWTFDRDMHPCVIKFKVDNVIFMQRIKPDTAVVVERVENDENNVKENK